MSRLLLCNLPKANPPHPTALHEAELQGGPG